LGKSPATAKAASIPLVAIVGNPNAGKTTLFNSLTGSHQKVANYPGVTVEKVSGNLKIGKLQVECIDVPGLYSLSAVSSDEEVAVEVIHGRGYGAREPDLLVCVVNAANLERNLFFVSQLAEARYPLIVVLTMTDLLHLRDENIDITKLSNLLGVDVVEVVGQKGAGIQELKDAIERNLESPKHPTKEFGFPISLETKAAALRERLSRAGFDYPISTIRTALLERNTEFEASIQDTPELKNAYEQAHLELQEEGMPASTEVATRYQWSAMVAKAVIEAADKKRRRRTRSDKIDYILTHRVFGLIVFFGVMYLTFQSIYTFARPLMNGMTAGFNWIGNLVGSHLGGHSGAAVAARGRAHQRRWDSAHLSASNIDPILLHCRARGNRLFGPRCVPHGPASRLVRVERPRIHSSSVELRMRDTGNHVRPRYAGRKEQTCHDSGCSPHELQRASSRIPPADRGVYRT